MNDAKTETAARVIAAATFRGVLKHACSSSLLAAVNTRSYAPTRLNRQTYRPCIQATAAVASARTASCVESENNASQ